MTRETPAPAIRVGALVSLAVFAQLLGFFVTLAAARLLPVEAFEAYVVAAALFILLATAAPLGSEKHALRHLPALLEQADLARARGLLVFGARRSLGVALVLAAGVGVWALLAGIAPDLRSAVVITCLSLPAGAMSHYAVEVLTAAGRPVQALALFRVAVPAVALALIGLMAIAPVSPSGAGAIAAWGIGWVVALSAMIAVIARALPAGLATIASAGDQTVWKREAKPFFIHRLSMSLFAQMPVLMLGLMGAPAGDVGAYAAAAATAGLITILATATNRAYGRELALRIQGGDAKGIRRLLAERARWLLPAIMVLLAAMFVLAGPVLSLFRPLFAHTGAIPLRILAIGCAMTVLFSLAPTMLKFGNQNAMLYKLLAIAAGVQLLLHLILIPQLGATGAALAQTATMVLLYGAFAILGVQVRRREEHAASIDASRAGLRPD